MEVNSKNVGRIAERIAMNELEARGYHIIDLAYMSKTAANVDFIASIEGQSFNVQVKGMTNPLPKDNSRWSVQYGYCNQAIVDGKSPFFNSKEEFALKADVVVLLAVHSPSRSRAIILPVKEVTDAAQINLDGYYRKPKSDGTPRVPHKVWAYLDPPSKPTSEAEWRRKERDLLLTFEDRWHDLGGLVR